MQHGKTAGSEDYRLFFGSGEFQNDAIRLLRFQFSDRNSSFLKLIPQIIPDLFHIALHRFLPFYRHEEIHASLEVEAQVILSVGMTFVNHEGN